MKKIMGRILLVLLICPVLAGSIFSQKSVTIEGFSVESNSIFINEDIFIARITEASHLLKQKSPAEFAIMQSVIGKIRAKQSSGANFNEEIMTIDIAKPTFDASLEWLASVLIHETNHIKKFKDTGKKFGDAHLMSDKKAAMRVMINEELECNGIQAAALQNVGGKKYEIDYLKSLKGDHFDINKDGKYDEWDYKNRNW